MNVLPVGLARSTRVWPAAALPEHNPYVIALLSSWAGGGHLAGVAGLSLEDFLRRRGNGRGDAPTLAAIDQVETFLRSPDPHAHLRDEFFDELFGALSRRPGLRLLVSVRTDHLDDLRHVLERYGCPGWAEFELPPFTPGAAVEMVRRSAESTGDGDAAAQAVKLVEEIRTVRDDAGHERERTADVDLLLLQAAGVRLWGDPPGRDRFLAAELNPAVDEALRDFCATTLAGVAADYLLTPSRFMSWFRRDILREYDRPRAPAADVGTAVLNALENRCLIRSSQRNGLPMRGPRHPRMLAALRQLAPSLWSQLPPDPAARLRAAVRAGEEGEPQRACALVREAERTCPPEALRLRAEIDTQSGNIAFEQGRFDEGVTHYRAAAQRYEAVGDNRAVGWLLTAIGRIALAQGRQSAAVEQLRAAVSRVPGDLVVQTAYGQALWHAGQPEAALAVLREAEERGPVLLRAARVHKLPSGS